MRVMPRFCPECGAPGGTPHLDACGFYDRLRAAPNPLIDWLAGLPGEYERLKRLASGDAVDAPPSFAGPSS